MKTRLFTIILFLLCFFSNAIIAGSDFQSSPIYLTGSVPLPPGGPTRVNAAPALAVNQTETAVVVDFFRSLGTVHIKITNEFGVVVYQSDMESAYGVSEVIDTTDYESGEYVITLTNGSGMNLEGVFYI